MNFLESTNQYDKESLENIKRMARDKYLRELSQNWINTSSIYRYVYNWKWLGKPIIQQPNDVIATQEIIFSLQPDIIIETGVARGGSIIFNASQLALLDIEKYSKFDVFDTKRKVIGIDIDIRPHTKEAIKGDKFSPMINLIEGSSLDNEVIKKVDNLIKPEQKVMVILDSDHTHEHVLGELNAYSKFVSINSALIVQDTGIEFCPENTFNDRNWSKGNNPLTATNQFLKSNNNFKEIESINKKLLITSSPKGYLKKIN